MENHLVNTWKSLPTELLIDIFEYLDSIKAIRECRLVCKAWDEPAAISMLGKPINAIKRYQAEMLLDYLESHPNKGHYVRHLTIGCYDDDGFLVRLLQQAFNPNIENLGQEGYSFVIADRFDVLYDFIMDMTKNSHVKFDKLKEIPHVDGGYGGPSKSYKQALWAFRGSLQSIRLYFYRMTQVQNLVYRFDRFQKLTCLDLEGYPENLQVLERILRGCTHLEKLKLTANCFHVWDGTQWEHDKQLESEAMLAWAKEHVVQVNSLKTLSVASLGYPNFFEYLMYKYPNTTKFVFNTFLLESAHEYDDDIISNNIVRIINTVKHLNLFEFHYQICPEQDLNEVCRMAQGDLNSMLMRYNPVDEMDTMNMHLTNTLLDNGTRSATFILEIPEDFNHVKLLRDAGIPIHSLELDFLNYSRDKDRGSSYDEQLPPTEQSELMFSTLYSSPEIKQIRVLAHFIEGQVDASNLEEERVLLESLEFCSARITEDALESIGRNCQVLNTLILTNCQLTPLDGHDIYRINMHSTLFDEFKVHTVPVSDIVKPLIVYTYINGEYDHVEQYLGKTLQSIKHIWSKPCYLCLAVSSFNKKVCFEIIPGNRNIKLITQKAFNARNKDSFGLRLDCFSIKSLKINMQESYLSLDERAIIAALKSHVSYPLEQDGKLEEDAL